MVNVWSKRTVIGPMPLDPWNWRHSGPWEPKNITDVESYLRRKKSSTYFIIQGVTQSGAVTEWSSKLLRNVFVLINLTVKATLFYAPYLAMLYQEYVLGDKGGRCVRTDKLATFMCRLCTYSRSLNLLETQGSVQDCTARAFHFEMFSQQNLVPWNECTFSGSFSIRILHAIQNEQNFPVRISIFNYLVMYLEY